MTIKYLQHEHAVPGGRRELLTECTVYYWADRIPLQDKGTSVDALAIP